jgi:hypothetical protein
MLRRSLLVAFLALPACKKEPVASPVEPLTIPPGFKLELEKNDGKVEHLDEFTLRQAAPDYRQEGRQAWNLNRLVKGATEKSSAIEIVHSEGIKTVVPLTGPLKETVLTFDRHGRTTVALIDPGDPFPAFHGRGGNRRRPGDPEHRFREVTRVRFVP